MSVWPFLKFLQQHVACFPQNQFFQSQHPTICKYSTAIKSSKLKYHQFIPGCIYGGIKDKAPLATEAKAYCSCAKKSKKRKDFDINNKIALVTGGANGIGYNYIQELLCNGAKGVTIADIDEDGEDAVKDLTAEFGKNKVNFIKTDVTNAKQLEAAFKKATTSWKGLDIVINNAGILKDSVWELEIAINCNHVARGTLLGIQYMSKHNGKKGGTIVNISSICGIENTLPSFPIYSGTKHFVVGLSRSFGTPFWYKMTGIRFLALSPGITITPLITDAHMFGLKGFEEEISKDYLIGFNSFPHQPTEKLATAMMTLIKKGANGSVWVAEGGEPIYEIEIPDRTTLRKD